MLPLCTPSLPFFSLPPFQLDLRTAKRLSRRLSGAGLQRKTAAHSKFFHHFTLLQFDLCHCSTVQSSKWLKNSSTPWSAARSSIWTEFAEQKPGQMAGRKFDRLWQRFKLPHSPVRLPNDQQRKSTAPSLAARTVHWPLPGDGLLPPVGLRKVGNFKMFRKRIYQW